VTKVEKWHCVLRNKIHFESAPLHNYKVFSYNAQSLPMVAPYHNVDGNFPPFKVMMSGCLKKDLVCKVIFFPPNFSFVFWKKDFWREKNYFAKKVIR
jgi:hypothetical protein